jgi:hypothetical protein
MRGKNPRGRNAEVPARCACKNWALSGACFANFGRDVTCWTRMPTRSRACGRVRTPQRIRTEAARLHAGAEGTGCGSDAVFIAVGTPSRCGDCHAALSYGYAAAARLQGALQALQSSTQNRRSRRRLLSLNRNAHQTAHRGINRICRERLPCDPNHLHQQDRGLASVPTRRSRAACDSSTSETFKTLGRSRPSASLMRGWVAGPVWSPNFVP